QPWERTRDADCRSLADQENRRQKGATIMTVENDLQTDARRMTHGDLLELRRWNTPTVYNGWEQITKHNAGRDGFNLEETTDFMPQMDAMVGYAITVVCEPSKI